MILARTLQGPNLHLMQLNTPRPEQALYKPKELLEALQASPLYDSERGQWNGSMDKYQELKDSTRYAYAQLLNILVLAEFDPKAAKDAYATALYNQEHGQWNHYMDKDQELQSSILHATEQLSGILVLAVFSPNAAKEAFKCLKKTALYDKERKQWNWYMSEDQQLKDCPPYARDILCARDQLLDILVSAEFDKNAATEAYEKLKDTVLYDQEHGQWNGFMNADQQLQSSILHATEQLSGILVLAVFSPNAAKEAYERLKTTQLYDKERKQWNRRMNKDQKLQDSGRCAEDQLLAILVESKLLKLFPPATQLTDETLPLPTVWRGR